MWVVCFSDIAIKYPIIRATFSGSELKYLKMEMVVSHNIARYMCQKEIRVAENEVSVDEVEHLIFW